MEKTTPVTIKPEKQTTLEVNTKLVNKLCDAQKADPTADLPTFTEFLKMITVKK